MPERTPTAQEMFAQFGVDTRTQQEILAERANQNWKDAMNEDYVERYPGDAGLQKAGAALGTALRNKFNNKLTAEEQREQTAAKDARAAVQQQVDDGMYQDEDGALDPVKRAQALQKEVAKALVRQNDDRGIAMLIEIGEREKQDKKDALERKKGLLQVEALEQEAVEDEWNWNRRIVNEMATVWPTDSLDPNDSVELYIDASGNARKPDTQDVVYPAGAWSKDAPMKPDVARRAIDGELTEIEEALLPSDKERAQFHRRERDVMTQMELGIGITEAMKEAVNEDGTMNIMGTGGKVTEGAVRIFDNIMSAGRGLSDALIITDENDKVVAQMGSSQAAANAYVKKNPRIFEGMELPVEIDRNDAIQVAKYQAILVQYAYGKARLNEENGRISDVDFEHAVQQIAAAAANPEALRQVLVGDVQRSVKEFNNWVDQIHPSVQGLVRTEKAKANWDETYGRWQGAFIEGGTFGSAAEVGEGLKETPLSTPTDTGADMSVTEFLNGGYENEEAFVDSFISDTQKEEDDGS